VTARREIKGEKSKGSRTFHKRFTNMGRKKAPDRALYTVTITANFGATHFVQTADAREAQRLISELRAAIAQIGASATFSASASVNKRH
jgi:hypothetical protein